MNALKTYVNTKYECKILEYRLQWLLERKEVLEVKYLGSKSKPMGEMPTTHNVSNDSSVIAFIYEYEEKKQRNGLSIKEEITALTSEINSLKMSLEKMEKALREMEGIEYQLFYIIKVEGKKPKKAVYTVSENSGMSLATIWRYYAKMKESLK